MIPCFKSFNQCIKFFLCAVRLAIEPFLVLVTVPNEHIINFFHFHSPFQVFVEFTKNTLTLSKIYDIMDNKRQRYFLYLFFYP